MLAEYLGVLVFFCIAGAIGCAAFLGSYLISPRVPDNSKESPYECGFPVFGEAQLPFDIRYYLLAIIFVVFDLELTFLIPWAICYKSIGLVGLLSVVVFLLEFAFVFCYLWRSRAFDWD